MKKRQQQNAVIPAHAGIQFVGLTSLKNRQRNNLDSGVRRNECAREGAMTAQWKSVPGEAKTPS